MNTTTTPVSDIEPEFQYTPKRSSGGRKYPKDEVVPEATQDEQAPKSYHTFITQSKRGPVEYAIKPKGQIVRLTPKPLNKWERRKLLKQTA